MAYDLKTQTTDLFCSILDSKSVFSEKEILYYLSVNKWFSNDNIIRILKNAFGNMNKEYLFTFESTCSTLVAATTTTSIAMLTGLIRRLVQKLGDSIRLSFISTTKSILHSLKTKVETRNTYPSKMS